MSYVLQTNHLTKKIDGKELIKNLWILRAQRSRKNYGDEDGHESVEANGRDGGAFWGNP